MALLNHSAYCLNLESYQQSSTKLVQGQNEEISYFNNPVLTPSQIKKFQKIFSQNTIEENNEEQEVNEKLTIILDQQEKEAFIHKLRTTLNTICLLHAITRPKETLRGKEKQYLTVKYTFDGNEICEKGFQIICSLSSKKWLNIRQHYRISSIKPIKHALSGRKSHNALSFATILNVLIFIVNFANCRGLPSPVDHLLCEFGKKYVPEIRFLSPRSDLCMLCKNMRFNTQYWTENERDYNIQEWNNHIKWGIKKENFI
ncbi:27146_t:CDS:2, partial [Gigaspora margarita]